MKSVKMRYIRLDTEGRKRFVPATYHGDILI